MKKKYIVFTTLFALIVTFGLLTASVFAALRVNFGINNTISFVGGNANIAFSIDGKIYGTSLGDGENAPTIKRSYDYNKATTSELEPWNLGPLEFESESENVRILYEFIITNDGEFGDASIKAYIAPVNIQTEDLNQPTIIGTQLNPVEISTGNTGTISLEISPINLSGFEGSRTCDFNVVIERAD